jgi:hypothetical protein
LGPFNPDFAAGRFPDKKCRVFAKSGMAFLKSSGMLLLWVPIARQSERKSRMSKSIQQQLNHDEIARTAYHLWEQNAKPAGRDVEFWLAAETLLRSQAGTAPSRRPARRALRNKPPGVKASPAGAEAPPPSPAARAPASKL